MNWNQIANEMGVSASWPSQILLWADIFAAHDPKFDREKFIRRASKAWEDNYEPPEIDDDIVF